MTHQTPIDGQAPATSLPAYGTLLSLPYLVGRNGRAGRQALELFLQANGKTLTDPIDPQFLGEDDQGMIAQYQGAIATGSRTRRRALGTTLLRLRRAARQRFGYDPVPPTTPPQKRTRPLVCPDGFPATWQGCFDLATSGKTAGTYYAYRQQYTRILRYGLVDPTAPIDDRLLGAFPSFRQTTLDQAKADGIKGGTLAALSTVLGRLHAAALLIRPPSTTAAGLSCADLTAALRRQRPDDAESQRVWRAFLQFVGAAGSTPLTPLMTIDFDTRLAEFGAHQMARGQAPKTAANEASLLRGLRRLTEELVLEAVLPQSFHEALTTLVVNSGLSWEQVSLAAKLPHTTLHFWAKAYNRPQRNGRLGRRNRLHIANLEKALRVPPGYLWAKLCPTPEPSARPQLPAHRQRGVLLTRLSYAVKDLPEALAAPIEAVAQFHRAEISSGKAADGARLQRNARGMWRTNQFDNPAEKIFRRTMAGFFGFLLLPTDPQAVDTLIRDRLGAAAPADCTAFRPMMTGVGMTIDRLDFAMVTDDALVGKFITFLKLRNENWSGHQRNILARFSALLHPETGWVPQHPELGFAYLGRAPIPPNRHSEQWNTYKAEWQLHCQEAWLSLQAMFNSPALASAKRNRDPRESLAAVLALPDPSAVLRILAQRLAADQPHSRRRAISAALWRRDCLLVGTINASPLRAYNIAICTYRPDQTGNLYKTKDGRWRLRFAADDFKNWQTAQHSPYDHGLPEKLWPLIDSYLKDGRPKLAGADLTDLLFLPIRAIRGEPGMTPASVSERLSQLVAKYLPEYVNWGSHAWRHIIATAWLKTHPNDFLTVAQLLHDQLATVLKEYAHLRIEDGLDRLHKHFKDNDQ